MIPEEKLDALRASVAASMSEKRFVHTAEVERMVARLAALYIPHKEKMLRAAALLHDITKEYSTADQLRLCAVHELTVTKNDLGAPKTFHARTAAAEIPFLYPDFADEEIVRCVRYHTTGRKGMTLEEKLVYLADYIDLSRTFPDCVTLRNAFFEANPEAMDTEERLLHLDRILVQSFDMTIRALLEDGSPISSDTFEARNDLLAQIGNKV